jgi:hypothetical protein
MRRSGVVACVPWSVRNGRCELYEPSENVEPHMRIVLAQWIAGRVRLLASYTDADAMLSLVATRLQWQGVHRADDFIRRAQEDTESFFDAIELLLRVTREPFYGEKSYNAGVGDLRTALGMCGSAWTVSPGDDALVLRVEQTGHDQVEAVVADDDRASEDLVEAWNKGFGRELDPSDAWDHAIRAVEHIYSPLVLEKQAANDQSTLGKVIAQLRDNRAGWVAEIVTDPGDRCSGVDVIRSMMNALWGNPDRHGGGGNWRAPELAEAQALVHLAVTLVQWGRQGVLRKAER